MPTAVSNTLPSGRDASRCTSYLNDDAPFPSKVYQMLEFVEHNELTHIVSWLPHGRAFKIHCNEKFMSDVAVHFFKTTQLRSIHRALNVWGFQRIRNGVHKDAWFHDNFLRGQLGETKHMVRTRIKGKACLQVKRDLKAQNFILGPTIQPDNTYISDLNDKFEQILLPFVVSYEPVDYDEFSMFIGQTIRDPHV